MYDLLDHIVYAVPDLENGIQHISSLLNTEVAKGGKHEQYGTHNALVRIGASSYLEIIASDLSNQEVVSPRWMGVDLVQGKGQITRWAVKAEVNSKNLSLLKNYNPDLGKSGYGSRLKPDGTLLSWKLSLPAPSPIVELCPFIIEWPEDIHPVYSLPQQCQITKLIIHSTHPEKIIKLSSVLYPNAIVKKADSDKIEAFIQCPNGIVKLS